MTTMQIAETLNRALDWHRRGDWDQATHGYNQVLAADAEQADALHLLGVLTYQRGDNSGALTLISRAIAIHPSDANFHANLGEVYRAMGQLDRAAGCCRVATRLNPAHAEATSSLGVILLSQGRGDEAIELFRKAIGLKPDFAMAYNNLANALMARGNRLEALENLEEAARLDPGLAEVRSNLGQILLEHRRAREALEHCEEAVRLRPDFAEARNNLGNVLRELGRTTEAKASYSEALRINPDLAITHSNLGETLQAEGKLDEAVTWFRCALDLDPESVMIRCNLAGALEEKGLHDEAIAHLEDALRIDPDSAEAHCGMAWVRREQGHFEQAIGLYRRAVEANPSYFPAWCDLGSLQVEIGDLDDAERSIREALQIDPENPRALSELATMLRVKLPEGDARVMDRLLADPDLPDAQRMSLLFGSAQYLDAQGAYSRAAEALERANSIRLDQAIRSRRAYHPQDHENFIDEMIAGFTPEFFGRVAGFGSDSDRPIFIVGMPRSGTTLTEQILASHSRVHGAGELPLARTSFESIPRRMGSSTSPASCLGQIDRPTVLAVAEAHLAGLAAIEAGSPHIVDKMPDNYLFLGLLAVLFPRARFIHCRRDPRDIAVSCWMTNFRQIRWSNDFEHIASRWSNYRRIVNHWSLALPVPVLDVDYEETVTNPESAARRLVEFCGLEWEPSCLAFHETRRHVRTASVTQVRQPIYTRSMERWRNYEPSLSPLFRNLMK